MGAQVVGSLTVIIRARMPVEASPRSGVIAAALVRFRESEVEGQSVPLQPKDVAAATASVNRAAGGPLRHG